jgi:hypothetical protein
LVRRVADAVRERQSPFALFDLTADPGEIVDVVTKQRREAAGLIRQLELELRRRPAVTASGSMAVDDLTEEQLRALGYIE